MKELTKDEELFVHMAITDLETPIAVYMNMMDEFYSLEVVNRW